ncbi:Sugar (and other) transporter [Geosmithia morbida]|uniref:Sugar (And other) transporter n=1 Tax=Geosmithia morbida TaxID=1094350 RepID=A0A9P4YW66_9HYPO|nr:Sugar (and other) transporter [Geosmithia morbida]KAF4122144.1 Sugar (and other) transporter [Geosmithia morbida]
MLQSLSEVATLEVASRVEPPVKSSRRMIQQFAICGLMFLGSTMNGYDGSLMGNMLSMLPFQRQFGAEVLGVKTGLISSMYQIGSVAALPIVGPCADMYGRRVGVAVGGIFIIIGTIVQGTSSHLDQFMAGRFFLGFGGTMANAIAPSYVVEFAHPSMRGVLTGLYNTCYYVGAVLAAAVLRGCVQYETNQAWLIPVWVQLALPATLLIGCVFVPESPRWLFSHERTEACRSLLTRYHGNGNPDSLWVHLQMSEFEQELVLDGADKRWWDYRSLFDSRASLYRVLLCAVALSILSQWTGQASVSYFLPGMLTTIGINDTKTVFNINLGLSLASGAAAVLGASLMDRLGRRIIMLSCCLTLAGAWAMMAACAGVYIEDDDAVAARASIAFIFVIGMTFSFAYTPLQAMYPVEVLAYEQRAKGMALQNMTGNAAALVNMFAIPVALERIDWKTYIVFLAVCLAQAAYYWTFMVETKGRTLEELNHVFQARNPRKASMVKKEVVDHAVTVVNEAKKDRQEKATV